MQKKTVCATFALIENAMIEHSRLGELTRKMEMFPNTLQ